MSPPPHVIVGVNIPVGTSEFSVHEKLDPEPTKMQESLPIVKVQSVRSPVGLPQLIVIFLPSTTISVQSYGAATYL